MNTKQYDKHCCIPTVICFLLVGSFDSDALQQSALVHGTQQCTVEEVIRQRF